MNDIYEEDKNYLINLIQYIKDMGYSQREIAHRLGITEASLSRYVNGIRKPRFDIVLRLEKEFNVEDSSKELNPIFVKFSKLSIEHQKKVEEVIDLYSKLENYEQKRNLTLKKTK